MNSNIYGLILILLSLGGMFLGGSAIYGLWILYVRYKESKEDEPYKYRLINW